MYNCFSLIHMCKATISLFHHLFIHYNYLDDEIDELRENLNFMVLYLMFENISITDSDVFNQYFYEAIITKKHSKIFSQTQKYVKTVIKNKTYVKNIRISISQQEKITEYFMSINCKRLNKKTIDNFNIFFKGVNKINFTNEDKENYLKEIFYIFIQEYNCRVINEQIEFYKYSIHYLETCICEFYIKYSDDFLNNNNIPIAYKMIKYNNNKKDEYVKYFINLKIAENVFVCTKYLILELSKYFKTMNYSNDKFYQTLAKNYLNFKSEKLLKNHKEMNFHIWEENFDQFDIIFKEKSKIDAIYISHHNKFILINSIEFWLREFFQTNDYMIELSRNFFIFLYDSYYKNFQKFLAQKRDIFLYSHKKDNSEQIFIYKYI